MAGPSGMYGCHMMDRWRSAVRPGLLRGLEDFPLVLLGASGGPAGPQATAPTRRSLGESEAKESFEVQRGDAQLPPGMVLRRPAVVKAPVSFREPREGAFDYGPVACVVGLEAVVPGCSAVLAHQGRARMQGDLPALRCGGCSGTAGQPVPTVARPFAVILSH